ETHVGDINLETAGLVIVEILTQLNRAIHTRKDYTGRRATVRVGKYFDGIDLRFGCASEKQDAAGAVAVINNGRRRVKLSGWEERIAFQKRTPPLAGDHASLAGAVRIVNDVRSVGGASIRNAVSVYINTSFDGRQTRCPLTANDTAVEQW